MRYERVRHELSHLTDRELAAIGIARSDIERVASGEARVQPLLFFQVSVMHGVFDIGRGGVAPIRHCH
jgi:hypothetical protein